VAKPGYKYSDAGGSSSASGGTCPINTYNPGYNRMATCYSCPSGMTTTSTGSTKKSDCLVPAGWTMNRGVLVRCPKGTYRAGAASPTGNLACTRCLRGWTTTGTSTTVSTDCSQLLPGYYGTDTTVAATACPQGKYYAGGGTAAACTDCVGYTTRLPVKDSEGNDVGAKSISECGESTLLLQTAGASQPQGSRCAIRRDASQY
jgi:hypothetical protein